MDWAELLDYFSYENLQQYLKQYENLGPLPGIILPVLEAFLPILPLIAIIIGNAAAYGLWEGFLWSWVGVILGASLVFWAARLFGHRFTEWIMKKNPSARKFRDWIRQKGFTPIFVLSCIPFAPSALINVLAGLSELPFRTFLLAIVLGKSVMIFIIAFIGHDLQAFYEDPWKLLYVAAVIGVMWWLGQKIGNPPAKNESN